MNATAVIAAKIGTSRKGRTEASIAQQPQLCTMRAIYARSATP